jgi:hypothetical protein
MVIRRPPVHPPATPTPAAACGGAQASNGGDLTGESQYDASGANPSTRGDQRDAGSKAKRNGEDLL